MEDEDFLAAIEADNISAPVEDEAEPQAQPQPETEPKPEPAPAVPEPEALPAPVEPEARPDPQHVPITAMLDERDKRKAEAERANKAEAELAQIRLQQQPQALPDMFEDPDGFRAHQESLVYQQALGTKLDISEEMARDKFGDELVDKARDWALGMFQNRPGYQQEVFQQRNPYRYVVEQYQRDQMASQVTPDDFAQFQAWKAAQTALQAPQPATPAPAIPPRTVPPRSLASAPSAGGVMTEVAQSDEEIFEETFSKE